MDANSFYKLHGREVCAEVADEAGTNIEYFSQIAYGHRRASVDLAHKLVGASTKLIRNPKERLDLLSLLQPKEHA
jgi:hypothetical protein